MCYNTKLLYKLKQSNLLKFLSNDDLKVFRDGEVTVLFGIEFHVWTTVFKIKMYLIFAHEQKLFLILELNTYSKIRSKTITTNTLC